MARIFKIKADDHGDDESPCRLQGGRCKGLTQVGAER